MSEIDDRLEALGIVLPSPNPPVANYTPVATAGSLMFVSGQLPLGNDGIVLQGKLGQDLDIEQGIEAARLSAINILAQAKRALRDLGRIRSVSRVTGFINGTPDFADPHRVLDGASDLLVDVLGERGRHSRTVLVAANLPMNATTLIDAILETD